MTHPIADRSCSVTQIFASGRELANRPQVILCVYKKENNETELKDRYTLIIQYMLRIETLDEYQICLKYKKNTKVNVYYKFSNATAVLCRFFFTADCTV